MGSTVLQITAATVRQNIQAIKAAMLGYGDDTEGYLSRQFDGRALRFLSGVLPLVEWAEETGKPLLRYNFSFCGLELIAAGCEPRYKNSVPTDVLSSLNEALVFMKHNGGMKPATYQEIPDTRH